jgi:hypothetical protein
VLLAVDVVDSGRGKGGVVFVEVMGEGQPIPQRVEFFQRQPPEITLT